MAEIAEQVEYLKKYIYFLDDNYEYSDFVLITKITYFLVLVILFHIIKKVECIYISVA